MTAFRSSKRASGRLRACVVTAFVLLPRISQATAEITVPDDFAVDVLLDQIDGTIPRLEAIRNPGYVGDYGFVVVAASIDDGMLTIQRFAQSTFDVFATLVGYEAESRVWSTRFDTTGLFDDELFLTVTWSNGTVCELLRIDAHGIVESKWVVGGPGNGLYFVLDFTDGAGGYTPGAYLEDGCWADGTALYHMDEEYGLNLIDPNCLPEGRYDLDIQGMEFDHTGVYNSTLVMADTDPNNDDWTVIYEYLPPDCEWYELTERVRTDIRSYGDMCISSGGAFGQIIYVTEGITDTVMTVDGQGNHEVFASGFEFPIIDLLARGSITVGEDGNNLFVSDANGIYRIRLEDSIPGPTIIMREPKVTADDVHTGPSGVNTERILFSDAVLFDEDDLTILDSLDQPVPFDVAGSNSQFMLISFGEPLLDDIYTIIIADTVVSADDNTPIDGDNDGLAGGDAVITMEHRCRTDVNNDSITDIDDLFEILANWGPCE